MLSMKRLVPPISLAGLMLLMFLSSGCQPIQLPMPEEAMPAALRSAPSPSRPDAPAYAARGSFSVGYREFVSGAETERPLDVSAWYPALNSTEAAEEIVYEFVLKNPEWRTEGPSVVYGHALQDAPVDETKGPYPLVIFSHGFSANATWYSTLPEAYASHGFIILAPEHLEKEWGKSALATMDRSGDITQVLDYAEGLNAANGELAGQIDMTNVAVVGHSFGGYTALAAAGAQIDFAAFNQRCAELGPEDPKAFLCMPILGQEAAMAAQAGLAGVPEGLWPSMGDPRVTAIVPIAGDAFLFDQVGLSQITVPMMAIGGTADTGTPYDWGSKLSYDHVSSGEKTLVGFAGAEHMFMATPCEQMPWIATFPYYDMFCFDPVWDKQRGLDLVHHFSTAFLLDVLKSDADAHDALLPDAVQFPGIDYSTTLQ